MFKKLALAAVSAAALSAAPAYAAPTITFLSTVGGPNFDQFIITGLTPGASFNVSGAFANVEGYTLVAADFTTTVIGTSDSNIDVVSATLNGVNFAGNYLSADPSTETGNVGPLGALLVGNNLNFQGVAGKGNENTIAGNLRWASVPEPSTWLMMMAGFGALGFALRRQKAATRRVNFNFA